MMVDAIAMLSDPGFKALGSRKQGLGFRVKIRGWDPGFRV